MNGNSGKASEADVLKAEFVYLLMKKKYRISRNVRAQWLLEHLNSIVCISCKENGENEEELVVISVVPQDAPSDWTPELSHDYKYLVTPTTVVIFLAEKYRMVFCLDVSPSLSAVDIQLGDVMIDGMFLSLKKSLEGLTKKFVIPGSTLVFEPDIYVTIIAHTPFFTSPAQQVLVQGWQVKAKNLPLLMSIVEQQLQELEGRVAEVSGIAQEQLDALRVESEKLVGGLFEDPLQPIGAENPMVSPDTGFINMLRFGMLALKLLPDSSSANIIVVTDGIINIPDVNVFDSVLSQLRSSTVACSFVQVAGPYHPYCCKGFVPYTELMHFIAAATLGAYILASPSFDNVATLQMNAYHIAFLTWSFQKRMKEFGPKIVHNRILEWPVSNQFHGSKDRFLIRKKQVEDNLNTSLKNVLSCRLREGYTIKSVSQPESTHIEVCLILPWKNNIYVEYTVSAPWPSPATPVHYTVVIEAPYEFLHDITCLLKKPFKSHYRQAVVSRFWHTLKNLAHTDQLLVHLHSFSSNVASHSLPESIRSGMPLFYLPVNSNTPTLSSSDSLYPQFSTFWKPVCLLDAAVWQKWLHAHRIGLLLQHDHPLPRHLHQANPSGRFQQVQCRQAAAVLYSTLKTWSSFVLIENHSFVKLIQGENAKTPTSFLLVRVTSKPPCVLLDMAFLGGTTGRLRHEIVEALRKKIGTLMLPQRPLTRDSIIRKISTTTKNTHVPTDEERAGGAVTWSDLNCCILLTKPVEKILIRYERMPSDFTTVVFPDGTQPLSSGKPVNMAVGGSMLTTLSRYLHHRRWIWVVQQSAKPTVNSATLTRTLSTITKMRIQEGFCFAHSTAGIINMLLEVEMKANELPSNMSSENDQPCIHPCVIQYVLFPPHLINIRESGSDEEGNDESEVAESEGELQIITECWIEPQHGRVFSSPQERYYMEGLSYDQLADEICKVDAECISSLLTFEHLSVLSQEGIPSIIPISKPFDTFFQDKTEGYCGSVKMLPEQRINYMPFAFNLMNLLPKCQQAELLFSVFIQDLSWSFPINCDFEGFSYLDSPNKLLLDMIYDNLHRCHGSELYLSAEDSQMFVELLQKRERDPKTYPLPLPLPSDTNSLPMNHHWTTDSSNCDLLSPYPHSKSKLTKHPKWKCFLKQINSTHLIVTFVPASFSDLKLLMLSDASMNGLLPKTVSFFPGEAGKGENKTGSVSKDMDAAPVIKESSEKTEEVASIPESQSVPEMKEQTEVQFSLDLAELRPSLHHLNMSSPYRVRANSLDTMAKKPGGLNELRKRTRTCSMDSRVKKKFSLQTLSPPHLTLENSEPKVIPTPEPQKIRIPSNHTPKYGAITLPILVYDCPLTSLIDVLVYKEHEKIPKDMFEDSTYSHTSEENMGGENKPNPEHSNASPEPKSEESEASVGKMCLKQHCSILKSSYSKSFVLSLFKSLQLSHFIHATDVQKAVEQCDETEIKIDITKFIQAVCGHLKEFLLKKNLEQIRGYAPPDDDVYEKVPLSFFMQPEQCQKLQLLHFLIKEKFSRILSDFFRVVPSKREYFYCAPNWERERQNEHLNIDTDLQRTAELDEATPLGSQSWEHGSEATLDTRTSDSVSDLPDEEASQELCPLFFHLLCSVQCKDQQFFQPVTALPTCLAELESCLKFWDPELAIPFLKVHLDLQCLTLPSGNPLGTDKSLNAPAVPPDTTQSASNSIENLTTIELKSDDIGARLCHIPEHQVKAVISTISEIQWLLDDELAACLLDIYPLTEATLQMVSQHIQKSMGRPSCIVENVPLHFVYGADHSMDSFLELFSCINLHGCFMRQEGKYFYLMQDKSAQKKSTPTVPQGMASLATPSSLAEDSSELWNICFPLDPSKTFSGLCSDSELQAVHMLDNTPTDDPLLRPYTDSKLQSPMVEITKINDEAIRRDRKISVEGDVRRDSSQLPILEGNWAESGSSSIPTPSMELMDKENITSGFPMDDGTTSGQELSHDIWDMKTRLPKQGGRTPAGMCGMESPVAFLRQHSSTMRSRHFSGAPSTPGPNSEVSSLIESGQGTEDGYEGDSSDENSAEDLTGDWGAEREVNPMSMPNFWLILDVTKNCVITYFHCRTAGQSEQDIAMYKEMRSAIIQRILNICKYVNQMALLQRMNTTRMCDDLLEPDTLSDPWKQEEQKIKINQEENSNSDDFVFLPGAFACNVVWETQFILHPRLKTGPAKRGIQALKSVLTRFSVNNRKNMFVYQEFSGNVYYLRLHESTPASIIGNKMSTSTVQAKSTDGEATPPGTLSVSRSPSISSLMARKTPVDDNSTFKMELRPRVRSFGERDSSLGSMSDCPPRAEDYVILKVHGISEAGPAIKVELVQVLQNRLADAVLELLCVMLSRNPMCKLTPEDVHFIQKPYISAHTCLEFCIQPHALSNLQAMIFYLKQNLLQFLHTPKYTDNRPENHFQDYSRSNMSKDRVFEEDIFLYNQSATCGSRGMACIALAVVDANGQLVQYNNYSKSSVQTDQNQIFFDTEFDTLTATKTCTEDIEKPPIHIEFRIWKQGRVNTEFLSKKLLSAIQHATWDLLMEFKLLSAPLSQQLQAQTIPTTTELASPLIPNVEANLDALCTSIVAEELPLELDSEMGLEKLESGESGQLHQVYHQVMCKWLNYAIDIGVPAVKKHSVIFKARQSLAVSLKELQRLITVNASDTSVAVFKLIPNDDIFVPYQTIPSFANDSRWDDANASTTCLLIGRNLKQWKACVAEGSENDPDILYPKAQKVFQKFPPLLISGPDKSSPTSGKCSNPPCIQFVPRQRLLIATLSDKEVTIFTYNWSKDRSENLNKQVSNLGHWLVGRSSLITSIITQKLGLFNNQAFNRQAGDLRKNFIDQSHLTVKEVEQLVKLPATAQKEFLALGRRSNTTPTVCIQDAFRDVKPSHAALCSSTDSVLCNGQQLLELCIVDKKEHQKKLYQLWQTRVATPNIPVTEDVLHLLQQNSRVIHFCLTPLLFLPSWRIQAAATRDHTLAPTTSNIKQDLRLLLASRSRNESGNSMKSTEGSRSTKSGASPQTSPKARRIHEDKWHQKLCTHFIQEYKQYLHTLGFVPIQTELNSPKKGVPKLSTGSGTGSNSKEDRQRKLSGPAALGISSSQVRRPKEENTHFMQKSLLGGILIFEVLLNEPFFQAKLHALECSRLQSKTSSGLISQFTFSFLDECDKIKILMHLHSFTYDYHLRTIHNFVSSQQTNLKIGFHLKNFIDDFIKYYSKSPNYARNLVYSDGVCVTNTSTPAGQLYNFLWTHEDLYQMEVFSMSPETECCMENEYVLVQLKNTHPVTYKDNHDMKQTDDFDVTLIVAHENIDGSGSNTLHLKYFIILTSRREHYPKHVIERKLGKFCTVPLATPQLTTPSVTTLPNISESEGPTEEVAEESSNGHEQLIVADVIPHIEIRQEAVNYMGYYSSHEQLMQQLILQQASTVEQQVITMVEQGMVHCRTHILWETLLSSILAEDKSKRRELSFDEFCELLKLASVESLSMLDHRLAPLLCQSLAWYQSLDKLMTVKYGTEVVKRFLSPDSSIQHTVVLSTNYLEAFTMLSVDVHTSRGELSIVCKKTPQTPDANFNAVNNLKLLSPSLQSLIEGFVNACCYHLWASLV